MDAFDVNNGRYASAGDTLYSHVQRVYLKSKNGEEKSANLRVNLELKSSLTISSEKVLSVLITDDDDSTFYYSLLLAHEDFRVLKAQQGLLLDFGHFPSQLVKLLDVCRSQEMSKFILVLDEEDADVGHDYVNSNHHSSSNVVFFKVIETNNFKNLCHLSLKVVRGSDSDIKRHMSGKIARLTEKLGEREKKCNSVENKLREALKSLEERTKELNEVQLKLAEERSSLRLETSHQISEEREKLNRLQHEWQNKLECEKSQIEAHYQKLIGDLNEQINLLTFNNKNLYEAKCQLEISVKEKNFQIESLDKQISQYAQELTLLRKQNSQLEQDCHEKDKAAIGLKTKLVVAEQEIKDKGKLLEKQQELWRVANEQKAFLEESLNERDGHLQRKQIAIQNMSADLMKSNEIISKLQTDLAANKAKMKLRTDIALEQERILEKKTREMASQAESIKHLEEKLERLTREMTSTKAELEETKRIVSEKDAALKKNDNVINWLNRRLTESTTSGSIPSARSGNDTAPQSKSNISNLTKGWPPWLANSVAGRPVSSMSHPTTSSTPLETAPETRLPKSDENERPSPGETKTLDPKYFQACMEIDKSKVLKAQNGEGASEAPRRRPPVSAYFPRRPVQLP